jgi:capsular exopolysaccharide synthesis family protein
MAPMSDRPEDTRSWLQPPEEAVGLRVYIETLRERIKLIALITLITTAIALAYVLTASKVYESQAEMLITPVSSTDPILATLGLITDSSEPTRPIETASKFVTNIDVAQIVKKELGTEESAEALLGKISAEPVAQSNVVAVTAKANSPEYSRELANAFANAAVVDRTKRLHERIATTIPQLEQQIATTPTGQGTAGESLGAELALLQTLRNSPDPTIAVDAEAASPGSQVWPRTVLSVVGGIFAGLVIGIAAAFAAQALDARLRREEQLRRSYRLPILARVPRDPSGRAEGRPLNPRSIEPITTEAYRTLRATFLTRRPRGDGRGRIVLVTGSSVAEGKTSTAVNLAASLALAGKRVILIDSDLRRPSLARALDVETDGNGVVSTLLGNTTLEEALISLPDYGGNLRVLPADNEGGWIAELFSIPAADTLLEQAAEIADFVVIDSAPLTEVVDALPLARQADDVLIVVRLGRTRLDSLARLTEILAENEIRPAGFAIVNARRPGANYDYHEKTGIAGGSKIGGGLRRRVRAG